MPPLLQAALLGLAQGLTEFLPISSSAHLVLIPWLCSWDSPILASLPFDIALHLGTLAAILVYFRADWFRLARAAGALVVERRIGEHADRRLACFLVLASFPGALAGLVFEKRIEAFFHTDPLPGTAVVAIAFALALLGALLLAAEHLGRKARPLEALGWAQAFLIGCAQALAIFPGVSRSGSTITAGLALGLTREAATRFSFLLSAPLVGGAGVLSFFKLTKLVRSGTFTGEDAALFATGFGVAALSGLACIHLLLRWVRSRRLDVFVYYRWALAALVLTALMLRGR